MAEETKGVLVGHSREDEVDVLKLKELLESQGIAVRDYSVGPDNPDGAEPETLKRVVEECSILVVYLSTETKDHKWIDAMIDCANSLNRRIVGVWAHEREEPCGIPGALEDYHNAVVGWTGNRILDAVSGKIEGFYKPDGSQGSPRDIDRYVCRTEN